MACSTGAAYPALRLLRRWHASGGGPSLAYGSGLLASSARPTSRPSCLCSAPPPWPAQARRGAHMRSGGRPSRSPTVRRAERQQLARPPDLDDSRPAANRVFPADPSTLIAPLETAIDVLASELTAADCLDIIAMCRQVYVGKTVSEAVLKQDYNLTPYKMHSVALLLLFTAATADGARHLPLATTLLHMAGSTPTSPGGYLPSTLTVLSMFSGGQASGPEEQQQQQQQQQQQRRRMRDMQFYQDAEKRFLAYLSTNQDVVLSTAAGKAAAEDVVMQANAFTQAGLLAEAGGNPSRALRWFRAARDVGAEMSDGTAGDDVRPREPRWDWERRCLEAIGRLQAAELRQQQSGGGVATAPSFDERQQRQQLYREARAAVRTAALALNSGVACFLLATEYAAREAALDDDQGIPPKEDDRYEVETLLYRAAAAAIPGASEALAARAEARLMLDSGSGKDGNRTSAELRLLAEEWRAIAAASTSQP